MADINAIAQQFTDFYYQAFDTNRSGLGPLYVRRPIFYFYFFFMIDLLGVVSYVCCVSGLSDF